MNGLIQSINNMPGGWFAVLILLVVIVSIILLQAIFKNLNIARLIADTPQSKIRSAAQGFIELKGKVALLGNNPLKAPLSGEDCCWYYYRIEQEITTPNADGSVSTNWEIIDSGQSARAFKLQDDTGECVINPMKSDVKPHVKSSWRGSSLSSKNTGSISAGLWTGIVSCATSNQFRFTEHRIDPGDTTYALGYFTTFPTSENPMKGIKEDQLSSHLLAKAGKSGEKINKVKNHMEKLFGSKLNHMLDEVNLSIEDWDTYVKLNDKIEQVNYLSKKERPYIISTFSEKKLVSKYRWQSFFSTFGFLATIAILFFIINSRLL